MSTNHVPSAVETVHTGLDNALGVMGSIATPIEKREMSPQDAAVLRSNEITDEVDPFNNLYESETTDADVKIVKPSFNPYQLASLLQMNNTLSQCVAAMEVNIDGTGFEIERADGESTEEDPTAAALEEFFSEPYPDTSLVSMRRRLRRDLEATGNAYIEVLRNSKGDITVLNRLDPKITRLVRLGEPTIVERTILRNGVEQTVKMMVRERRFAQVVGSTVVYFKEFGSTQFCDKRTGKFSEDAPDRSMDATEVVHLKVEDDVTTPYGVPRWINQIPSVLGSRKAEEFNLEFFDHGGLPPALIMIQGGQLTKETRQNLTTFLSGKAKYKQRGVMVEAYSTGGDINSSGSMRITVERFGAERQGDSMFENYDARCSERVRGAFRLPPLFLGLAQDYNFATAYTAYMVAEAQVFQPERTEFDDMINVKLMKELAPDYVFRSLPLSVKDVETQLKALSMVGDKVEGESFVDQINEIASTNLIYEEPPVEPSVPPIGVSGSTTDDSDIGKIFKMDDSLLTDLARDWAGYMAGDVTFAPSNVRVMKQLIDVMAPPVRKMFNAYVGNILSPGATDPEGVAELMACVGDCQH